MIFHGIPCAEFVVDTCDSEKSLNNSKRPAPHESSSTETHHSAIVRCKFDSIISSNSAE